MFGGGPWGAAPKVRICEWCGLRGNSGGREDTDKVPHGQPQPGLSGALECKLCWEGSQPRRGGDAVS